MPGNILNADTGFPSFTEDMTSDQKIDRVMNYLYMLLEQLRYTLFNLGVDNFNGAEIDDLAKIITDPVYLRLEDGMGNLTSLQITVEGLTSRVQNAEGDVSVLQQTADSISGRVQNMEGDLAQVTLTAEGLVSRVSSAEGNISTLTQTAEGLSSRVSSAEGNISTLTQTAESLSARITNSEGDISELRQTAEGLLSRVSSAEGSISTLTQTAESLSARITNSEGDISDLTQTAESISARVQSVEGNLAQVSLKANENESEIISLTEWKSTADSSISSLSGSLASISQKANENGASISQIVEAVGEDGEVSAASIVAAVNASGSSVRIKADKIEMTGTTTFVSSSENSDGELEIDGNSLGIFIDGTRDNGSRDLESTNGINFYYDWWGDGKNVYKMGRMYTRIEGETDDVSSRYALCIDTMPFENSNGDAVETALKLMATGRGSFEAKSLYLNGYLGFITLDAVFNTRIFATASFAQLQNAVNNGYPEAASQNGYCFCTDGIYYNGVKILDT